MEFLRLLVLGCWNSCHGPLGPGSRVFRPCFVSWELGVSWYGKGPSPTVTLSTDVAGFVFYLLFWELLFGCLSFPLIFFRVAKCIQAASEPFLFNPWTAAGFRWVEVLRFWRSFEHILSFFFDAVLSSVLEYKI